MCQEKRYSFVAVVFLVIVSLLTAWGEQLQAQQKYPTRAIDMIIPMAPGGSTDMTARVIAEYLKKKWGVSVNPINKPGGLTVPACLEVYNAKPDGYTVLGGDGLATTSLLLATVKDPPFKIMDRIFLGIIAAAPYVFTVPFNSPIKTLKDLEAEIKKDPGNFTWVSVGGAGANDYGTRKFMTAIGIDPKKTRPIICKGGAEPVNLTVSGAAKLAVVTPVASGAAVDAKLLRVLAVAPQKRVSRFPDVPTVAEEGYPAASYQDHLGVSGPPNLPSYIVEIWEKAMEEMSKDPDSIAKIDRLGLMPFYLNARETRELRLKEMDEAKEAYGIK